MDDNQWTLLKDDILPHDGLEFMDGSTNQFIPDGNDLMMDPFLGSVTYLETHTPPPPPLIGPPPTRLNTSKKRINRGTGDRPNARKRTNPEQALLLETAFKKNPKPDKEGREELALQTGLPSRNVQIWFQNRRAKARSVQEAMKKTPRQEDGDCLQPFPSQYQQNPLLAPSTPIRNSPSYPALGDPFTTPPNRYTTRQQQQQPGSSVLQTFPFAGGYGLPISPQLQGGNNMNVFYGNMTGLVYPAPEYYLTPDGSSAGLQVSPQVDMFDSDYNADNVLITPQSSLVSPNFSPYNGPAPGMPGLAPSPCFEKFPNQPPSSTPRLLQRRRPQYEMNDINTSMSKRLRGWQGDGNHVKSASATELFFHPSAPANTNSSQPWMGSFTYPSTGNELHRSFSTSGLIRDSRVYSDGDEKKDRSASSSSSDSIDTDRNRFKISEGDENERQAGSVGGAIPVTITEEVKQEDGELVTFVAEEQMEEEAQEITTLQEIEDFLSKEKGDGW